jgi:hypothetical protein
MKNDFTSLHDSESSLLMSYHDNDHDIRRLSYFDRLRLNRLLSNKPEARDFLDFLQSMSRKVSEAVTDDIVPLKSSLWKQIDQRINQEERAALYLGKRELSARNPGTRRFFSIPDFNWGLYGATTAGLTILLMTSFVLTNYTIYGARDPSIRSQGSQLTNTSSDFERPLPAPVRFASQQDDLPQIIEPARRGLQTLSSVDVDWVHSDGAVRFYSDPHRNSTMIWVKKRTPVMRYLGQGSALSREQSSVSRSDLAQFFGAVPRNSLTSQRR